MDYAVVLSMSVIYMKRPQQSSSLDETRQMLTLIYERLLLVLSRHERHRSKANSELQQRLPYDFGMLSTGDTDVGMVINGRCGSEPA
jgi:hypothetical protein